MIYKMKLGEVEDFIDEKVDDGAFIDIDGYEVDVEGDDQEKIVLDGYSVKIPALNLKLYPGTMCQYDESEDDFMPDWSLTAFYEAEADPDEDTYLYYEQDGILTSLHNYLVSIGKNPDDPSIDDMDCELDAEFDE